MTYGASSQLICEEVRNYDASVSNLEVNSTCASSTPAIYCIGRQIVNISKLPPKPLWQYCSGGKILPPPEMAVISSVYWHWVGWATRSVRWCTSVACRSSTTSSKNTPESVHHLTHPISSDLISTDLIHLNWVAASALWGDPVLRCCDQPERSRSRCLVR